MFNPNPTINMMYMDAAMKNGKPVKKEVTDPDILAQLNAPPERKEVTDPAILAQLNTPPQKNFFENIIGKLGEGFNNIPEVKGAHGFFNGLNNSGQAIAEAFGKAPTYVEPQSQGMAYDVGNFIGKNAIPIAATIGGGLVGGPVGAAAGAGITGGLTTHGTPTKRIITGAIDAALPKAGEIGLKALIGAGKYGAQTFKNLNAITKNSNPEKALEGLITKRNNLFDEAIGGFKKAAADKAAAKIKIPFSNASLKEATKYLSNEEKANLIPKVLKGEPEAIHQLQSNLGDYAREAMRKEESAKATDIYAAREKIQSKVANYLEETGHSDIAQTYKNAQDLYRQGKELYHSSPKLEKVFNPYEAEMPENIAKYFGKNNYVMKNFLQQQPEFAKEIVTDLAKQKAHKQLTPLTKLLGIGAGAGSAQWLLNFLNNSNAPTYNTYSESEAQ